MVSFPCVEKSWPNPNMCTGEVPGKSSVTKFVKCFAMVHLPGVVVKGQSLCRCLGTSCA